MPVLLSWFFFNEIVYLDIYRITLSNVLHHCFFRSVLMLTIGCEIGAYGKGCSNQCSGHCLDSVT